MRARTERDLVPVWMDAAAAAARTDPDKWDESIITICVYLEHAYRRAQTGESRATWIKRLCGYGTGNLT